LFVKQCIAEQMDSTIAGWEYEACLVDTNPGLDQEWVRLSAREPQLVL